MLDPEVFGACAMAWWLDALRSGTARGRLLKFMVEIYGVDEVKVD
jgi:hypothetical protein